MRRLVLFLSSPLFATAVLWTGFAACIDAPDGSRRSLARLVVAWDPLACGDPHRIVVELGDDSGAVTSASTPCSLGTLAIDVARFGSYHGRIYAWALGAPAGPEAPIDVTIDQPIVRWPLETPP
jgi:hypothetical protein